MYEDILITLQFPLIYEVYNIEDYFITLEKELSGTGMKWKGTECL